MIRKTAFLVGLSFWLGAQPLMADQKTEIETVKKTMARIIPGQEPEVIAPAPLPDMYEVVYGAQVMYVSKDGRYVVQGDVIDLQSMENVTEGTRSVYRKKVVDALDKDGLIIFSPTKPVKHAITVFTDIDCGYCRKLHRDIDNYMAQGIEIRYASFPRTGKFSKSYHKAVSVWCAADRKDALTRSKAGEELPKASCDNPVDEHMAAAEQVGVTGTPTLVLENGEVIPGYVPAERLAKMLR